MKNDLPTERGIDRSWRLCRNCHNIVMEGDHCSRCHSRVEPRRPNSLQYAWALLLTAVVMIFPANFFPITQTTNQGVTGYDTIYTGILSLVESEMAGIAVIVFVASIVVPVLKIAGLTIILTTITLGLRLSRRWLMLFYHFVQFIGRWSMLDLFVIGIVASLINMGQLLDAKPAPAATFFAMVILFTQLAAKSIDTRLLWDLEYRDEH
ncbi:paraquat-inducible membrane protein A [Ferrimonas sediminicola]|uniref:Paraquat-inducible membrane protein A n=1 Tax=Ferrimonas sediminicola TaxID=2569538 RepID=A0A4U1BJZ7_9GAMM|nr:paraquat-inducible protein A [Ferrimonas sediminicola]TKB50410.1 paraquat-inducible membrane protein A [Ferrimonas sediminicola]